MPIRERFMRKLGELQEAILQMGVLVDEELQLALAALDDLDPVKAQEVIVLDQVQVRG